MRRALGQVPPPAHRLPRAGGLGGAARRGGGGHPPHRKHMTRVLVAGGGMAGYCAALAARRAGAEVTVVARAPGATALYAGAMEVVDDLDAILKSEKHHPFTRLGMDSVRLAHELDTAIHLLVLALEKSGLKFEGGWRQRGQYADIHGTGRPGHLVPATVAGGELRALARRRLTAIGRHDA